MKTDEAEERALTRDMTALLDTHAAKKAEGTAALAVRSQQTNTHIDPDLFIQATGAKGWSAVKVSVEAARQLLSGADLAAISETTESPVLRVAAIARKAGA